MTFNKDIAPIIWARCAACHRPGQAGPFSLLAFADVQRRASQIAEVTASHLMPPWLPESPYGQFANERRLKPDELAMLQQWISEGAVEGSPADLPPPPPWPEGWILGGPDLVVTLDRPYTLATEGRDVYRNFVIPIPVPMRRFVRAVELRPGNARVVHHAFMYIDRTGQSRRLAAKEGGAGFPGMGKPDTALMPEGQFLAYQPGKLPTFLPDGMAWTLEKDSDLVLQVHMNPTGKPERVQPSVGFYFTDKPPVNTPFKLALTSLTMDIPPGATDYVVTDSFKVPVDVSVTAVLPHAHYLAREMLGTAALPDGSTRTLLDIRNWDFNWQGDYRFARPVYLPAGSTISMRFTYDNSTNNARNPSHPPKPVTYGPQSADEMAELWLLLVVRNAADRARLADVYALKSQKVFWDQAEFKLGRNPNDAKARLTRAMLLAEQGRADEALPEYLKAIELQPDSARAHFDFGLFKVRQKKWTEAKAAFEKAIQLDPEDNRAQGSLGIVYMNLRQYFLAIEQFEKALRLNPDDTVAKENLQAVRQGMAARGIRPP